jgi:predicted dehydrogenase
MKSSTRLGLVGAGAIAQVAHLPVLAKMRGVELTAICDNDGHLARALADRFSIPNVFSDIEDLLDAVDIDAVVVATPNHLHEPHVLRALAANVAVLCERPLALTSRGVERILAAADEAGCVVSVANNHRFRNDVQTLDGFIRGGELGRLNAIRAGSFHPKGVREGWRLRREEAGGGAFFDYGVPLLDLALWLADYPQPVRVWAHMDRPRGANSVEEAMLVQVELSEGLVLTFDVNAAYVGAEERWWFEVLSSRGSARLAPLRVVKELNGRAVDVSPTGAAARESAFIQSYRAELAHFLSVLRKESAYEPPADQVLLHRIVEAIYRSAEERSEIRL